MVLLAGIGIPENLRSKRSRILRAPAGVLLLYVQDKILDLKGKPVGVAERTPAAVRQPLNAALLVAVENLVARLARNPKLPAKFRMASPASRRATNCILSSVTEHSFQGTSPSRLREESVTYVSGTKCYLCLRPLNMD